jgi:hypothetical protein
MSLSYIAETLSFKDVCELGVTMVGKAAHRSYVKTYGIKTTSVF